jgi:hypothetical protein
VVTVDEFANLTAAGTAENKPLADLFDEFLAQFMRNNRVFLSVALQSVDQVDYRLRQTLFRLGTIITSRAGTRREARVLADLLFRKDIYRIKHHKKVWGKVDPPPYFARYADPTPAHLTAARLRSPDYPYYILDYEPEHMSLQDQEAAAAETITKLGAFEFLCRPAVREGAVSEEVIPFSIRTAISDPETGGYQFPDPDQDDALIAQVQHRLAARSGIPVTAILKEQEARLAEGIIQPARTAQSQPAVNPAQEHSGRLTVSLPDRAHQQPQPTKVTQSRPTLDDQQKALLALLIEQPDMPVSGVYKRVGVSVRKGNDIRESLKQQGFLVELELRSGRAGAGRPMKCILPSFQAFEQLGIAPPKGRGSAMHRQLQQMVAEGARAKGYSAQKEKVLDNGTIVDVHLEKGQARIAVEIAIASRPELELSHFRNCLAAGYDQVYAIFADGDLLARTAQAIEDAFSEDVTGRVRLLPVSHISHLGS